MASSSAYTPTLTITPDTVIRRERRLPLPGEVRVAVGEVVSAEQIVAATALPGRVSALNVARELNLPPAEIERWMVKHPGDPVAHNEVLAEYKSFFGFFKAQALSPTTGTLEAISAVTGQALVRGPALPVELSAYVSGAVVEIVPQESVTIECRCALLQGILGVGGEAHGPLAVLGERADQGFSADEISDAHAGCVVVSGTPLDWALLERLREVGAAAVVVGAMPAADLDRLLGAPLGVAITGQERLGLTVVLTEGFGSLPMAEETFALLRSRNGAAAAVNGATQIRAGVLRPEVIIPLSGKTEAAPPASTAGLAVGSRIRLVRDPYFGRLGHVSELPSRPEAIPTEAEVRVLRARLDDGEEVTVPRANVELIER
ncbi:MAG TPA: hypothetical protein VGM19_04560 [Armatimonadota bacterium]|jgi:hypothetical protein